MTDRSVVEAWDEVAPLYGAGSSPFRQFAERLAAWAGVATGERVVDLGCGNGLGLAALLDGGAAPVTGVDFSRAMLAASAERLAARAPARPVALVQADVVALPFPDGAFHVAVASSVFQFVGYAGAALREWRRVLAPGGRLALSIPSGAPAPDGPPDVNLTLLAEFFGRLPPEAQQRLRARPRVPAHPPDLGDACRAAGFAHVDVADVEFVTTVPGLDAWWDLQWTHGFRGFLREFDEPTLDEMRARAFDLVRPRCTATGEVEGRQVFRFVRAR